MSIYNMNARKPSDSERKAYDEGLAADRAGKRHTDNPYPYLSLQYTAWSHGHASAR